MENTIKEYANLQIKQARFELIEFLAKERAAVLHSGLLLGICSLLVFFGSLYASTLINSQLESDHLGYGIVFLFWTALLIVIALLKKTIKKSLFNNYANKNIPV